MRLIHVCSRCRVTWEEEGVPTEHDLCYVCRGLVAPKITPAQIEIVKEVWRDIQKVVMVVLTLLMLGTMIHVGNEIVTMRNELTKCRATIETMKVKIIDLTAEIAKGIRVRLF